MHSLYFNISIYAGSNHGIPNDLMQKKNKTAKVPESVLPTPEEAVNAYQQTTCLCNIPGAAATAAEWIH